MRRALLATAAAAMLLAAAPAVAQDARETSVQRAARDWLALIDRGDYAASWKAAGAKFRLAISPERWTEAVTKVRGPLGPLVQRSSLKTTFTRSFPGVPDGDYSLVVFRTAFEKKTEGDETVTLEREADGEWRVVGYFIR
jgi:hypothetical protein